MKRYDLSTHAAEQSLLVSAALGDFIRYSDHAAFVAKVREVAEGMGHDPRCQVTTYRTPFSAITRESDEAAGLTKCTCPRGRLLAICDAPSPTTGD